MPAPVTPEELETARFLAVEAGRRTLRWFRRTELEVATKSDGTVVTEADHDAESYLRTELQARFENDGIVGEEHGRFEGSSGRWWVIDPIDGTTGFALGVPLYATLLASYDDEGARVGVIALPAVEEVVSAGRGIGCWWNGQRCRVAEGSELRGSLLTTSGFSYWSDGQLAGVRSEGCRLRTWGDGYGYAMVATGRAHAMVDPVAALWDLAPMPVILDEAGGRFSDLAGRPVPDSGNGLATNGLVHERLLAVLAP